MSNQSLKNRITLAIDSFNKGSIDIKALKSAIELNGQALEGMSYDMVKENDDIEHLLLMSQYADEEDCETEIVKVIPVIEAWLKKVPS
jgi:hypothetical protein